MKNGVGYITLTDRKVHFLIRKDRNSEPLVLSVASEGTEEALKAVLDFARTNEVPLTRAVVVIDGRNCFLRNYQLLLSSKRQLDLAVSFEMDDDLPMGEQDVVKDHFRDCLVDGMSYVCAAAVKKDYVSELLSLFEVQGVHVERVDVDAAAFARACASRFTEYERYVGLEIGRERALFCHLVKGKVRGIAVIPWGGESSLMDLLAKATRLPEEEVDRLLVLGENGNERLHSEFAEQLNGFLQKILREVYRLLGNEEWPSRFVVSGDIVRIQKFREAFESLTEGGLDIWEEFCLKLGDEVDEGQRGSGLAVAYGAAEDSGASFNFRKGEFAVAGGGLPVPRDFMYAASLLLAILVAWGGYAYAKFVSGERELQYLETAMLQVYKDALPNVSQDMAPMQYMSILSSRLEMLTGTTSSESDAEGMSVIETLRTVSAVLDKSVDVEFLSLSLDARRLDVAGETKTMNEVDKIRAAFDKTKAFRDVKVKNAVADKRTKRIRFEIEVQR